MARLTDDDKDVAMIPQKEDVLGWRSRRGSVWADLQPLLDRLFAPFEDILTNRVLRDDICNVLDVGCGTGASTLAFARRLTATGGCTGIDISPPMLDIARSRATAEALDNAHFIEGDAQRFDFGQHRFDAAVSRFGVMFFDQPERAFANIRRAVRGNGTLTSVVWRGATDNPFMVAGERAAAPLLGWADQPDTNAPGQFAFADATRVDPILRAAGWTKIRLSPIEVPCQLTRAELGIYVRRMGRVGLALADLDPDLRNRVEEALDDAVAPFVTGDIARFDAACWLVEAQAA